MKTLRAIFYVMTVLTLCEVMEIRSFYAQNSTVNFSSDWMEPPLEEDESKEMEDEEDFFIEVQTPFAGIQISAPTETPSLYFDLAEPLHEIVLPPPQG